LTKQLATVLAWVITVVWVVVALAAVYNPDLVALATVVTPVMLLPAGWVFTDDYFRRRRQQRDD
jgi:ABC-type bacteriocin/lantibiotic exporter with double-glycine peptidase domain